MRGAVAQAAWLDVHVQAGSGAAERASCSLIAL